VADVRGFDGGEGGVGKMMLRGTKQALFLTMTLVLLHTSRGSAQAGRDSSASTTCKEWLGDFATGNRARIKGTSGRSIGVCGAEGARAMAAALRKYRHESDVDLLNGITLGTLQQEDRRVADAAFEVALDRTASTEARVISIRTLISLMRPGTILTYQDLKANERGWSQRCSGASTPHPRAIVVELLPSEFREKLRTVMETLKRDQTPSRDVQAAASCAMVHFRVTEATH
jgi:hypothetical protein